MKEMRLCGIDKIVADRRSCRPFIDDYNTRFAKASLEDRDIHRSLAGHDDLDDVFACKDERSDRCEQSPLGVDQIIGITKAVSIGRPTMVRLPRRRLLPNQAPRPGISSDSSNSISFLDRL